MRSRGGSFSFRSSLRSVDDGLLVRAPLHTSAPALRLEHLARALLQVLREHPTTYRDILAFFFQIHDPSTLNRQGNDIGTSYRSAIFPLTPEQEKVARDTIADVDASGLWPGKALTTIEPAGPFWEAEPEHQDYLLTYPNGYTCHFPRPDWVLPRRTVTSA